MIVKSSDPTESIGASASFVRWGGVAGLLATALGLVVNVVLLAPPPPAPDLATPIPEVAEYIEQQAGNISAGHALRYPAQILLLFFGVAAYCFVRGPDGARQRPWALLGLLAAMWVPSVGIVANSVEVVAVWQAATIAEQPQLLTALWGISGALWNSLLAPFATLIIAFSLAGRMTGVLPKWLVAIGLVIFVSGAIGVIGHTSVMTGGWIQVPAVTAFLLIPVWIAITSILMLRNS
jgi:hypothetical protein